MTTGDAALDSAFGFETGRMAERMADEGHSPEGSGSGGAGPEPWLVALATGDMERYGNVALKGFDWAAGGPQKRRRIRRANAAGLAALAEAQAYETERQQLAPREGGSTVAVTGPPPSAPRSFFQEAVAVALRPTPVFGMPLIGLVAAGLVAWKVLR